MFLERAFVEKIFCLDKFKKKDERHQKKPNRKRKTRKTQTKKIKGQLENRRVFALSQKKRWSKNQEEIKEVLFFFKKTLFSNEIFFIENLF